MGKRNYNQFCPLAYAMDIIGERWTLLIVREMLFGPRRYTDLLNALPGIGTNLLSARLKSLEENGIIAQKTLPPPAASQVYELTEFGNGLRPVIASIARWGTAFIDFPPPEDDHLSVIATLCALDLFQDSSAVPNEQFSIEVRTPATVITLHTDEQRIRSYEGSASNPDLVIKADLKTLLTYFKAGIPLQPLLDSGDVTHESGDLAHLEQLAGIFKPGRG